LRLSAGDGNGKTACHNDCGFRPDLGGRFGNPRPVKTFEAAERSCAETLQTLFNAVWSLRGTYTPAIAHVCVRIRPRTAGRQTAASKKTKQTAGYGTYRATAF